MPRLLRFFVATILALAAASPALAQSYPNRPIRVFVGYPPGGAADIIARLVAQALSVRLGQPLIVDNRPGSGTNMAGDAAAKSAPDGYSLLHGSDNLFAVNPHVYAKMPFDPMKDVVPIATVISNQYVLAVHPSVPVSNLREFVEHAKRTKPPLFYGSIGNGSSHHLAMEMLKRHTDIELTHVPYRGGGPAAVALLAGEIQTMWGGASIVPTLQSGKARGLATTGKKRFSLMPELPTVDEIYPGYELLVWHAWFAPAGTPQPIIDRLRTEINALLKDPEVIQKLATTGSGEPFITTPEEFRALIKSDYEKYGKVIKALGLRIE
jgi:tripartite-type tricarboxylate transporter receptor subunit TctC